MLKHKAMVRKQVIERQLKLRELLDQIKSEIKYSDHSEKEKDEILYNISQIEEEGEFEDAIKMLEISKFKSYDEYKEMIESDPLVIKNLNP